MGRAGLCHSYVIASERRKPARGGGPGEVRFFLTEQCVLKRRRATNPARIGRSLGGELCNG
jgi:hypothetical protein